MLKNGFFLALFTLWSCGFKPTPSETASYGGDSKEVELKFKDHFFIPKGLFGPSDFSSKDFIELSGEQRNRVEEAGALQIKHLFGVFSYHSKPIDFVNWSGSIKDQGTVIYKKIRWRKDLSGVDVSYEYQDWAVFYKDLVKAYSKLSFYLPDSPHDIFNSTLIDGANPCTDAYDNSELAFWYYWSPQRPGCWRKIKDKIHLVRAEIKARPSSRKRYPEYGKLYADNKLDVTILYGPDQSMHDPKDLGYQSYLIDKIFFETLKSKGEPFFKIEENHENQLLLISRGSGPQLRLRLHFLETDTESFDKVAQRALRETEVFIYAGHSNESHDFDLERLFPGMPQPLPQDKYQIMFFNACTTYAYYGEKYFAAKSSRTDPRGSRNLDLLTNAIGAPFLERRESKQGEQVQYSSQALLVLSLFHTDPKGRQVKLPLTWQQILGRMARHDGFDATALTFLQGEEDNPQEL